MRDGEPGAGAGLGWAMLGDSAPPPFPRPNPFLNHRDGLPLNPLHPLPPLHAAPAPPQVDAVPGKLLMP